MTLKRAWRITEFELQEAERRLKKAQSTMVSCYAMAGLLDRVEYYRVAKAVLEQQMRIDGEDSEVITIPPRKVDALQ